jgi:hypothetical protein
LFYAAPFKADFGANGERVSISDIAFGSECLKTLEKEPVRHYVIESTKHDAAMCQVVVPTVIRARGKFAMTNIILQPEIEL